MGNVLVCGTLMIIMDFPPGKRERISVWERENEIRNKSNNKINWIVCSSLTV